MFRQQIWGNHGCRDGVARNYDKSANVHDPELCEYHIEGCTVRPLSAPLTRTRTRSYKVKIRFPSALSSPCLTAS